MPAIRKGDNISIWTGHSYRVFTYAGPNFDGQGHAWLDSQGHAQTFPVVYPGQSFFYQNNGRAPITNVFYGTVAMTNSTAIPGGHAFTQLASTIPVVSPLDGTNLSLPFQPGDCVSIFTGGRYDTFTYRGADFDGLGHAFTGADGRAQPSPMTECGQGFIYQNNQTSAEILEPAAKNPIIQAWPNANLTKISGLQVSGCSWRSWWLGG